MIAVMITTITATTVDELENKVNQAIRSNITLTPVAFVRNIQTEQAADEPKPKSKKKKQEDETGEEESPAVFICLLLSESNVLREKTVSFYYGPPADVADHSISSLFPFAESRLISADPTGDVSIVLISH